MTQYIVAFGFFAVGFVFMALMLHFGRYKKGDSCCCGDSFGGFDLSGSSCATCPNQEAEPSAAD